MALFVIAVVFVRYSSKRLARPLKTLRDRIEGINLDTMEASSQSTPTGSTDEIVRVWQAFSDMTYRLNEMIRRELFMRSLQAQAHYRVLQSQINPHFLYNTLGVIGIMGEESGDNRISNACESLAGLLKYSISYHDGAVTLEKELHNTQKYLELMRLRYEHKITYRIESDSSLGQRPLPKMTLQPFVENAVKYGFSPEHKAISITVTACALENGWALSVVDDGKGFPHDVLAALQEKLCETDQRAARGDVYEQEDKLGIVNTFLRIQIYFGERVSFRVANNPGGGAVIAMEIIDEEDPKCFG
jgi:two-component system sensor histidine kinase YesM